MTKLGGHRTALACLLALSAFLTTGVATASTVSVQLNAYSASLRGMQSVTFAATVNNTSNQAVTWNVNGIPGGNLSLGVVTSGGVYTAPQVAPSPNTVSVTAVSAADSTKSATATVSLYNPVPAITGLSVPTVRSGQAFTEQITGSNFVPASTVTLSDGTPLTIVSESATQITVTGTTSSPGSTILALQVFNPDPGASASNQAPLSVANQVTITVWPTSYAVRTGNSFPMGSSVGYAANTGVTWSVNGVVGGNSTFGTITTAGLYTAPAVATAAPVTITATSVEDTTKSASCVTVIQNPIPSITSVLSSLGTQTVVTGRAFTAVINGANFLPSSTVSMSDGTPLSIVSQSATQLTVTGNSSSPAGTTLTVQVANPNPGGSASNQGFLVVVQQVAILIWPKTVTMRGGSTQAFQDEVQYSSDPTVTWLVNGIQGGNAALGFISSAGVYTAPAVLPATPVTVTVQSAADPTKSDACTVALLNPIPIVAPITAPVTAGANASVTITGSGFAPAAQVQLGGVQLNVTWVSSTQLTATGSIQTPIGGMLPLRVTNPDPGGTVSNQIAVPIQNPGTQLSYADARLFLEHATWGPTADSIAHLQSVGIDSWLNEQFDPVATPESSYTPPAEQMSGLDSLQSQFFSHALTGPDQLRQRVAFALGQIFVTSGIKLNYYYQMAPYQQLLLDEAFGKYGDLLHDVALSPGMGNYLDMVNNDIAAPGDSPNENFARESMQLFSIGLQQLQADGTLPGGLSIPIYTEADIQAYARVLTGWTFAPCGGTSQWPNPPCYSSPLVPFESHHDNGAKTFLGTNIQTGSAEGDLQAALNLLTSYQSPQSTVPNIAPFISRRLIQHLVTGDPDPSYVGRVAAVYASSGGDLKQVVKAILTDPAAGAGNAGHLREPAFYEVSLLRALGIQAPGSLPTAWISIQMGQNVFFPASVFNYYSPFYMLPGTTTVAPEFQILNEPDSIQRCNWAYWVSHNDLLTEFALLASDTNPSTQNDGITAMLNAVSQALLGTAMPANMASAIMPVMLATTNATERAQEAVFLVAASPQYQVQH